VARFARTVEDDRLDEGETYEAILRPFNDSRNENAAFEPDMDLRARSKIGDAISHQPAF